MPANFCPKFRESDWIRFSGLDRFGSVRIRFDSIITGNNERPLGPSLLSGRARFSHTVPRSALSQTSTWKPLCFVNTKDSRKRKMRKKCLFSTDFWSLADFLHGHFCILDPVYGCLLKFRGHICVHWFPNDRFLGSGPLFLKVFSSEWRFRKIFHYKP